MKYHIAKTRYDDFARLPAGRQNKIISQGGDLDSRSAPFKSAMSQDQLIKLACSECKRTNYWSRKNKKLVERKIELKKFCRWCKKQTVHKETKK